MRSYQDKSCYILFTLILSLFVLAFFVQKQSIAANDPACEEVAVEISEEKNSACQTVPSGDDILVYLPFIRNALTPVTLNPIDNSDQDNAYVVTWTAVHSATYTLEEASDASFSDAHVVYEGGNVEWAVPLPDGRRPGTNYYRVMYEINGEQSRWSNAQSVVIYPLYVGLGLRWDGISYLDVGDHYETGTHLTRQFDLLSDPNTLRTHNYLWYDPNPLQLEDSSWDSFYSLHTGEYLPPAGSGNSPWKWSYPWILPYDVNLQNGQIFNVEGQAFLVSGPHSGTTAFGHPVQYWQLINRDRFVLYDDGGEYQILLHANEVILHFDAGATRLLLHDDIIQHFYHNWSDMGYTAHDISNLTAAGSFGYPPQTPIEQESSTQSERGASPVLLPIPGLGRAPYTRMLDVR